MRRGGWIIGPNGRTLARTSRDAPFATVDIDLAASDSARTAYPGYVFRNRSPRDDAPRYVSRYEPAS